MTFSKQEYELCVLESKPGKAVSIIECDMSVSIGQIKQYVVHMLL